MPKRIAIVEDEAELAALIDYNLSRNGYEAQILGGAKGTLKALENFQAGPDSAGCDAARGGRLRVGVARYASRPCSCGLRCSSSPPGRTRWTACSASRSAATIT